VAEEESWQVAGRNAPRVVTPACSVKSAKVRERLFAQSCFASARSASSRGNGESAGGSANREERGARVSARLCRATRPVTAVPYEQRSYPATRPRRMRDARVACSRREIEMMETSSYAVQVAAMPSDAGAPRYASLLAPVVPPHVHVSRCWASQPACAMQ